MSELAMRKILDLLQSRFGDFQLAENPITGYTSLLHRCSDARIWSSEPLDPGVSLADLMIRATEHLGEHK